VTEQDASPGEEPDASVHELPDANDPLALLVNVTLPVGARTEVRSVSLTVAVHVVGWPTLTGDGVQETAVWVASGPPAPLTASVPAPELDACAESPPYAAVIPCSPEPTAVGV